MIFKRAIGAILLALPFVASGILVYIVAGWTAVLFAYGGAGAIVASIYFGSMLLSGDDE